MIPILTLIFFFFGLIIGSFLNVVIYRLNTEKSLGGRSACMSCRTKLSWYELIPLLSFLVLGGRCKSCQSKISLQYPLVEFMTGLVFALLFFKFQNVFFADTLVFMGTYAYYALVFSLFIVLIVYDAKHKIIPDTLSFLVGLLAFCGLFLFKEYSFSIHVPYLMEFLSGPILASPFALLWLLSRGRWMGLGDAKLVIGLGWLLGLQGGFSALVLAFWMGAIIGVMLMLVSSRYKMRSEIPFAPYLILGTFLVFFFQVLVF